MNSFETKFDPSGARGESRSSARHPALIGAPDVLVRNETANDASRKVLAALDGLAARSPHLISKSFGPFTSYGRDYILPRYVFVGPKGGGETVRLGIFATIHGDEPEGALGLTQFATELEHSPDIAQGYALFLYPICNPTGLEDGTRHARTGKDLNREFWRESRQPEVRYLESEIWTHAFDGLIMLHTDNTSDGLYAFVSGAVLAENLIEPALTATERILPRNMNALIDGFPAQRGIITDCYAGVLKSVPQLQHPPFEITLETPQNAPVDRQVEAFSVALKTILTEYRQLLAIAQNI